MPPLEAPPDNWVQRVKEPRRAPIYLQEIPALETSRTPTELRRHLELRAIIQATETDGVGEPFTTFDFSERPIIAWPRNPRPVILEFIHTARAARPPAPNDVLYTLDALSRDRPATHEEVEKIMDLVRITFWPGYRALKFLYRFKVFFLCAFFGGGLVVIHGLVTRYDNPTVSVLLVPKYIV